MRATRKTSSSVPVMRSATILALAAATLIQPAVAEKPSFTFHDGWQSQFFNLNLKNVSDPPGRGPPEEDSEQIPIQIANQCADTMWPGIATQSGTGPGTGGFELGPGYRTQLWVSWDWQGRIWGRTNCTVEGDSASCDTGDCFGKLDCDASGATPATLAEFTLSGGEDGQQTFYDISLVDGYNLPLSITYLPAKNTTFIPPNLTNAACIATPGWLHEANQTGTVYSNESYPIPWEMYETNDSVRDWCPWPFLAFPPTKPGDGIFPYPDDNIRRPPFAPCNTACSATGDDKDCCVGKYHNPKVCKPSRYSTVAKAMCPDAYNFAYDDQKSTFIVPKGGGWEVVLCPDGRSTNILRQLGAEMFELAAEGSLSSAVMARLRNTTYINMERGAASCIRPKWTLVGVAVSLAWVLAQ